MIAPFELSWQGGASERHFRRLRPGIDDLPWHTLDPRAYPPRLVARARAAWTEGAFNEYCTAAAFAELIAAMLAAGAPVDLVGMASEFVADELVHVELNARMAMQLGGGAPVAVDFAALAPRCAPGLTPLQRASELAVRVCCVGEAFSVPMLAATRRAAGHPLTRAVLERIVRDEPPHARLGWLFLDWAGDAFDDAERTRLATAAGDALAELAPAWQHVAGEDDVAGVTREGFAISDVHALGWMEARSYAATARAAVQREVIEPLARRGIHIGGPAIRSS